MIINNKLAKPKSCNSKSELYEPVAPNKLDIGRSLAWLKDRSCGVYDINAKARVIEIMAKITPKRNVEALNLLLKYFL